MKLLQRTGRYYILFSTLIFLLWGVGLFFSLQFVISHETNERLKDAKSVLVLQLSEMDSLPSSIVLLDNVIEIQPLSTFYPYQRFTDTLIWNAMETEHKLSYRKLVFHDKINGQPYRIGLNHSKIDMEEMLTTIVLTVLGILGLLLFTINLFNRSLSLRIWKPFYQTVQQIKTFTFDNSIPLSPPPTQIDEFDTLHQALHQMTTKILSDYQSLKQFTENASHEIQTPLAIIKNKIELLLQEANLNKNVQESIHNIQKASSRLSRLNHSLLLLTRIENRQYTNTQRLNLKILIENQLDLVEPLVSAKQLSIHTDIKDVFQKLDVTLAEILLSNLLGNAIKHNLPNGYIKISLNKHQLQICNPGEELTVPSHKLFERFHKGNEAAPSLGLGLAIVKEICSSYDFEIKYNYKDNQHCIAIIFNTTSQARL